MLSPASLYLLAGGFRPTRPEPIIASESESYQCKWYIGVLYIMRQQQSSSLVDMLRPTKLLFTPRALNAAHTATWRRQNALVHK